MTHPDLLDTLQRIQDRLSQGASPSSLIEELLPRTQADGTLWARRLTSWQEHRGRYPDQAVAIARSVSLRALRAFGLVLTPEGRIESQEYRGKPRRAPEPSLTFPLSVENEEVQVEFTADYFPGRDHFAFVSPHSPARPHGLSPTGYLSQFARRDAVEACGGSEGYAARFAEAKLRGREREFEAAFEGRRQEEERSRRKKGAQPVLGEHTAKAVEEKAQKAQKGQVTQGELF